MQQRRFACCCPTGLISTPKSSPPSARPTAPKMRTTSRMVSSAVLSCLVSCLRGSRTVWYRDGPCCQTPTGMSLMGILIMKIFLTRSWGTNPDDATSANETQKQVFGPSSSSTTAASASVVPRMPPPASKQRAKRRDHYRFYPSTEVLVSI
ncbi:hypothetical protein B0H16DRAFT_134424 [Mycena metata]|uniref:Uncharacterized protein n=1 Tax=Mycena metata TaxID=1033252 RepID=A0AAD7I4J2_9AGAR|nr:hypothetical protein B0H16DRAFT_134424 [Mycena metata]